MFVATIITCHKLVGSTLGQTLIRNVTAYFTKTEFNNIKEVHILIANQSDRGNGNTMIENNLFLLYWLHRMLEWCIREYDPYRKLLNA